MANIDGEDSEGIPLQAPVFTYSVDGDEDNDIVPIDMTEEEVAQHLDITADVVSPDGVLYGRHRDALHREVGQRLGGLQDRKTTSSGGGGWQSAKRLSTQTSIRSHVGRQRENATAFLTDVRPVQLSFTHVTYRLQAATVTRMLNLCLGRRVQGRVLLNNISGTVPPGSMVAIVGPSGTLYVCVCVVGKVYTTGFLVVIGW
jgi:ABC-type multidrug transport system fused ATPase/permease subunit